MANYSEHSSTFPFYMQLCAHSEYYNVNPPVQTNLASFPLLLCNTAVKLLPRRILVATFFQPLHNNVLQAIRIAAMHEK